MRRVPTTSAAGAELVPMFRDHMELCGVGPGQTVMAFTNTQSNPAYITALMGAVRVLGGDFFQIMVAADDSWMKSRTIVDAWKGCDLVVGFLASMGSHWIYSDAHNEALAAGVRSLMIEEPEDHLRRMFPLPEIRKRGERSLELLATSDTMRVWSDAGSDFTVRYTGRPLGCQYGYTDQAGRWDHWPSGQCGLAPLEDSAEGTLVVDAGDALLPMGKYVEQPIRMELREGNIVSMEGGADARLLKDFFELPKDKRAYGVSHIGWGFEHRANWNALGLRFWEGGGVMDTESYYGNMLIAFGANFTHKLGGKNRVNFHFDIPTRNHSIGVGDTQIIDRGQFVVPGFELE